ncbi:MAG: hypothetical protein MUE51_16145 [Thermoleophilia bacterium]|jgi:hypothetical protein|nr:hypothetical protein [Thermoleophilia bacterium]
MSSLATVTAADSPLVERAMSDYLAVSRGAHLYATPDDHERAEARAWERLVAARAAAA